MKLIRLSSFALVLLATAPVLADGHFKLLEPASRIVEDQRGDPQKAGPCGGATGVTPTMTGMVSEAKGGSSLHIKVQETIFHPGHYRVALAVNSPSELPVDPKATLETTERGPRSVSGEIMNPVQVPVLADGLFPHSAKVDTPLETDVTLPNISCKRCTLQVIQFMEQHGPNNPGLYTYHHCATIQITADPKKPIDATWPKERAGS
jgi:hypothetical protein